MKLKYANLLLLSVMLSSFTSTLKSAEILEDEETPQRVIGEVAVKEDEIDTILSQLSLSRAGNAILPLEGRIATNRIIPTLEKGKVVIRLYPDETPEKLETGNLDFEITALTHLSQNGINVPHLLKFKDGKYALPFKNKTVVVYPFIEGETLSKEQLSEDTALLSGTFLKGMLEVNEKFISSSSSQNLPRGDLQYITDIYNKRSKEIPTILETSTYTDMLSFVKNEKTLESISKSPQGIVHADFFFENFVVTDKGAAAIDFGDAYYGAVVMDAAIGAMEFSAVTEEKWNFKFLEIFLKPIKPWLSQYNFTAEDFLNLMQANCLRFAIYTAPFTVQDKELLENNSYAQRFKYLSQESVQKQIKDIFNSLN